MFQRLGTFLACICLFMSDVCLWAGEHPLPKEQRAEMERSFARSVDQLTKRLVDDSRNVQLYSARGDAQFFLGQFKQAVADYDKMVELDSSWNTKHWRRGIAYFYAGDSKKAAHQFEVYHTFDDVDRENGIWRFLSQTKAHGIEKARRGLLKYQKDDREPFPAVYRLFAGETTPDKILKQIQAAKISDTDRQIRLFYAHLYIGLNHAVENRPKESAQHLKQATANKWAPRASYGPKFMWHVGRLHYDRLAKSEANQP